MSEHPLTHDSVWLQQRKYEEAEAFYQKHLTGPPCTSSRKKNRKKMAEAADTTAITDDLKRILKLSTSSEGSPSPGTKTPSQSKTNVSTSKKKRKSGKTKKEQAKSAESTETLETNKNDNGKSSASGSLSISVDRQGNRTLHQQQVNNTPDKTQWKGQNPGKKGIPKSKQNINDAEKSSTQEVKKETPSSSATPQKRGKSSPENYEGQQSRGDSNRNNSAQSGKKSSNSKDNVKPVQNTDTQISEAEKMFKDKLENNWIFPLRKKSTKFPRANFFCRVCSYHLDLKEDCNRHMGEKRHQRRKEVTESENILRFIPKPTEKQLESLDVLLKDIYKQQVLTTAEIKTRKSIVQSLKEYMKKTIPDIEMEMYGSTLSGFGLKTSDINIYVHSPSSKSMPKVLVSIYEQFKESGERFKNVENDFYSKVPAVIYEDPNTSIKCQLTINSCFARDTSRLLSVYSSLDPRVVQLGITFRTWAKICGLDRQKEGTLPAYSLSLMTVYYLQNTTPPILPTFHKNFPKFAECEEKKEEWFSYITKEATKWKTENKQSLSELWLGILRFYVLNFDTANEVVSIKMEKQSRIEKKWNSKKLAIEDPFAPKLNVARTVSNAMIYEYLQDTLRKAYHYFGLPRNSQGESWIPMKSLETMAATNALKEYKQTETLSNATENNSNHERTLENSNTDSVDRVKDSPLDVKTSSSNSSPSTDLSNSNNSQLIVKQQQCDSANDMDISEPEKHISCLKTFALDFAEKIINHAIKECKNCHHPSSDPPSDSAVTTSSTEQDVAATDSKIDIASFIDIEGLQDKECFYQFTEDVLSDGKGLPVICGFCEGEGHLRNNCPEDVLPKLRPLPGMTAKHLGVLSETLKNVIYDFAPTAKDKADRRWILKDIENFIQQHLYPNARLQLFGSSCNGFGFSKSDLDICLTFKDKTSEGLDYVQVIKNLSAKLERHEGLRSITAITTAKVPIVKFRHRQSGLEGDISLYNTLAQHNTTLLEMYSCIDERVSILGYALKVFAKVCEIGDASKGSLSSYAYVLMLLHYLQQVEPPVIPVLQELHTGKKPELIIEGWNVWFYDDFNSLRNVWPGFGKNTQSIGELWLGLFKYYSEFPVKDNVITIRQKGPLSRFEKLWNGECLAIEDPFDLSHNLGGGLSKKMNNYIFHALIHARELYGTPFETVPNIVANYNSPADYFFDPQLLTEGRPPNDRGCRECGKIGHIAKKCPQHLKNVQRKKEREARQRELKQQQQQIQNHRGDLPRDEHSDRNGHRHTPNREPRRRNNSYNEYSRDRAPLLPTPVIRTRNDSHPGNRPSPQPLMDMVIDNGNNMSSHQLQSSPYNIHQVSNSSPEQHHIPNTSTNKINNNPLCNQQSVTPAGTYVTTSSGCRVFLPSNTPSQQFTQSSPQANIPYSLSRPSFPTMTYGYQSTSATSQPVQPNQVFKMLQQPLMYLQPMSHHQGPNGSQNFNIRNNTPPRHKSYYVNQSVRNTQGRPQ
ncbi:hypothetical protein SNE40_011956 [Patella caerulea]|uniref:CCHC-type domain-containing protein n=1 Tax=Patella caerulea TaxID=87958 RepID=A0AAN8JQH0_PATCE